MDSTRAPRDGVTVTKGVAQVLRLSEEIKLELPENEAPIL